MTNDMIALASNWEDRLRTLKCDRKEDPQVWATSFPHLLTLTQKEKMLNPKAMINGQWFIVSYDSVNKQKHHKSHRMQ